MLVEDGELLSDSLPRALADALVSAGITEFFSDGTRKEDHIMRSAEKRLNLIRGGGTYRGIQNAFG
jgi:hypothetical protein